MPSGSMIVIGAGIAGMSTGCYALMNGYDTTIFEMHNRSGGLCTSWQRKGYTFDYCIHNLAGTRPDSRLSQVWDELGALKDTEVINHEIFQRVESPDGKEFNLYCDLDRLERHMKEISPEDSKIIDEYVNTARSFSKLDFMGMGDSGPDLATKLSMITKLGKLKKYGSMTIEEFSTKFKDPFLRRAFRTIQYNMADAPMMISLVFMSGLNSGDLGWPKGGSLEFSKRIESRFIELGGDIRYRHKVNKIIVENDRAVGVELEDGSKHYADIVISAADGYATIFGMLDGHYLNDRIRSYYDVLPKNEYFGIEVNLGVDRDISSEPHAVTLLLDAPLMVEDREEDSVYLELFDSDSGLCPPGKGVIKADLVGSYEYWKALRNDDLSRYQERKDEVAGRVIEILDNRFPGLRDQIEVVDVTTPVTCERYTGNLHGYQPWPSSVDTAKVMREGLSRTLPGLAAFFMVGHWAGATVGVSTVALMGRDTIEKLCRMDGKKFVTQFA
jgi:phytoene dehydrogenase-like protein